MNDIKERIEELTQSRQYALRICQKLINKNHYKTLDSLLDLDIIGKKLETLFDLCGVEQPIEYLIETVNFLSAGYIDKTSMNDNLNSDNPIEFIYRLPKENEDKSILYSKYTSTFYSNLRESKNKRK